MESTEDKLDERLHDKSGKKEKCEAGTSGVTFLGYIALMLWVSTQLSISSAQSRIVPPPKTKQKLQAG